MPYTVLSKHEKKFGLLTKKKSQNKEEKWLSPEKYCTKSAVRNPA